MTTERWAQDPDTRSVRAFFAECAVLLAMDRDDTAPTLRLMRYPWAGRVSARATGRPRERWHVSDFAGRIDANELRRRAIAEGIDLRTLQTIDVQRYDAPDNARAGSRLSLTVAPDARYDWRVRLLCPGCGSRRVHLFPILVGYRCRKCARIGYYACQ